ncbi:monocarboxylate transporter 12-like isoform X1 [Centruroides sculpturatus]|uniref:monocarboxylate transporter 12-like isoform X1 n=1 Tax=Centruroides sculpturatus TaxID=218467 RepID=UPI000C6D09B6|nr:monocarboxylate transporter 12-like isoform X1 [Centruroides sculpturatus]
MADARRSAVKNIDGGWAWVVAFSCFISTFTVMGLFRSAGVMYVALVEALDITREMAAWPLSLCGSVMLLVGPIVGMLTHYFSIRVLMIIGTLLTSLGVSLCYIPLNLTAIVIFLGAIYGIGIGFVLITSPVIINQYFLRYRTIAIGITFSGASAGSIALPPLIEYLLETYGLRGCFLLLGGVLLHGVAAASLCRPPNTSKKAHEEQELTFELRTNNNNEINFKKPKKQNAFRQYISLVIELLCDPMYQIINFCFGIFFICFTLYITILVDFAMDRSIAQNKAVFIISVYSISDLFGRIFSGWIIDFKIIRRKTVIIVSFISSGILLITIPFGNNYAAILALISVLGLLCGSIMVNFTVLLTEYLGLSKVTTALGLSNFLYGILGLFRPMIIGHYRDTLGSYDYLFYTLGGMHVIAGVTWFIEPLLKRCKEKKENENADDQYI